MKNVFISDVSSTPPSVPDALLEGFPKEGSNPTAPGAWWYYMTTMEIMNAVSAGGLTPDGTKVNQLATVISNLVTNLASLTNNQSSALASVPYGALLPWPGETPPPGYIKANGILLSRTGAGSYPKLTTAVLAGNLKVVTDANWTSGNKGAYSSGDGSTNYRVPDIRADFLRGWDDSAGIDSGRGIGTNQVAVGGGLSAFQNALNPPGENNTGGIENVPTDGAWSGWRVTGRSMDGNDYHIRMMNQAGLDFRPRNVAVLWCIRAYDPVV